jgi:hypothetical protein
MRHFERGLLAEFERDEPMCAAARALAADGFREIAVYSPLELPGLAQDVGRRRSRVPAVMLTAALTGVVFAYLVQWYTAVVSYPLNAGGRPAHAGLAFVLITFETAVLFAACAGFVSFFVFVRQPRLWAAVAEIPGFDHAVIDRFWVGVSAADPRFDPDRVTASLRSHGPRRIVRLEAAADEITQGDRRTHRAQGEATQNADVDDEDGP